MTVIIIYDFMNKYANDAPLMPYIAHTILLQVVQPAVSSVDFVATVANVLMTRRAACAYCWKPLTWWEDRSLAVSNQSHR